MASSSILIALLFFAVVLEDYNAGLGNFCRNLFLEFTFYRVSKTITEQSIALDCSDFFVFELVFVLLVNNNLICLGNLGQLLFTINCSWPGLRLGIEWELYERFVLGA